ncbi:MAG TPA: DUF4328 domain-containing protein [Micromonosporaceae bacterium]|nr:DUF4328 domain-containing protein [Micromonosporaceae bacterium]
MRPGRTYALRGIGIAASVAVALVVLFELVSALWPLASRVIAERALQANDPQLLHLANASVLLVALPSLVVYTAAGVLVIIWFYRARVNLDRFPGAEPTMAAGWAIGGWFVPFANFVIPCRVMANIARDSLRRTPVLVAVWWAAWLVSQCSGAWLALGNREATRALPSTISEPADYQGYIDYYSDSLVQGLPSAAASVVAGAALIVLIWQISNAQQARIARANPVGPILPGATVAAPVPPVPSGTGGTSPLPPPGGGGTIEA